MNKFDKPRIERAIKEILLAIGENPDREGLKNTPARVAKMYEEIFGGLNQEPKDHLKVVFGDEIYGELVLVKDIPFFSVCEHHLVPIIGKANVGYIPVAGKLTGLSKLARVVDVIARRPQLQERLTTTIADSLEGQLKPKGVIVIVEAEHMCMSMRGIKKPGSMTLTSAIRGIFKDNIKSRMEAMSLINKK